MENIKTGDIIVRGDEKRKVLAVLECVVVVSGNDFEKAGAFFTKAELRNLDYTIQKAKWEPRLGEKYWYIFDDGIVRESIWVNDEIDNNRKNFLGIYETKQKAEEALVEIRKKLK